MFFYPLPKCLEHVPSLTEDGAPYAWRARRRIGVEGVGNDTPPHCPSRLWCVGERRELPIGVQADNPSPKNNLVHPKRQRTLLLARYHKYIGNAEL